MRVSSLTQLRLDQVQLKKEEVVLAKNEAIKERKRAKERKKYLKKNKNKFSNYGKWDDYGNTNLDKVKEEEEEEEADEGDAEAEEAEAVVEGVSLAEATKDLVRLTNAVCSRFSADSKTLFVLFRGSLVLYEVTRTQLDKRPNLKADPLKSFPLPHVPISFDFASNGALFVRNLSSFQLLDIENGTELFLMQHDSVGSIINARLFGNNKTIMSAGGNSKLVQFWDVSLIDNNKMKPDSVLQEVVCHEWQDQLVGDQQKDEMKQQKVLLVLKTTFFFPSPEYCFNVQVKIRVDKVINPSDTVNEVRLISTTSSHTHSFIPFFFLGM